jgi:hypothetical protein
MGKLFKIKKLDTPNKKLFLNQIFNQNVTGYLINNIFLRNPFILFVTTKFLAAEVFTHPLGGGGGGGGGRGRGRGGRANQEKTKEE